MNLVLGTLELTTIGGVGTYLATVAEHLERLGHGVTILTEEAGEMAALATERGLRVVTDPAELPDACDAVYAQDTPTAYALADHYRGVPQAFCLHSVEHDRWVVPQVPGVTSATVTLHDGAARYAGSMSHVPEVIRLRQPVDLRRFSPRGPIGEQPRRALVLGNYVSGNRFELVSRACADAGIEVVRRGLQGDGFTVSPEMDMNDSDIVIGKSRVIVEAMACGRAAYVYDHNGGDGWVTPERYAAQEAVNFDGETAPSRDARSMREDLRAYSPEMGSATRDLAIAHHSARAHCEALVELFSRIAPRSEPAGAPLDELSRLTRAQWQADARALGFEHEAKLLRAELGLRNTEGAQLQEETARARQRAAEAEQRAAAAEREADQARQTAAQLESDAATFRASHRASAVVARQLNALRRSRRESR
ncbi:MAG: hypothetical protein QOD14_1423 [Solirubrobacterales bacterium]|nr:hypothetical protein [Solirubrobacterales bacterium]